MRGRCLGEILHLSVIRQGCAVSCAASHTLGHGQVCSAVPAVTSNVMRYTLAGEDR
jgi:hypothetical protein